MWLLVGAKSMPFGSKIYAFWVHVYGSVGCKVCGSWVQSIWILLGACLCLLTRSLTVFTRVKWPREAHNLEGQEGKQGRGRAEEGHDTSRAGQSEGGSSRGEEEEATRAIDMHPKGIDMHPKVSIYFAPNFRILCTQPSHRHAPKWRRFAPKSSRIDAP